MDTLPKDVQRKLALELSPPDLINFCLINKDTYNQICNSNDFWRQKFAIDFPHIFSYFQRSKLVLTNPKNTYIKKFTEVSRKIEQFVKDEFVADHQIMYDIIYNVYLKILQDKTQNLSNLYKNELLSDDKIKLMTKNNRNKYIKAMYKDEEFFNKHLVKLMIDLINKDQAYIGWTKI